MIDAILAVAALALLALLLWSLSAHRRMPPPPEKRPAENDPGAEPDPAANFRGCPDKVEPGEWPIDLVAIAHAEAAQVIASVRGNRVTPILYTELFEALFNWVADELERSGKRIPRSLAFQD